MVLSGYDPILGYIALWEGIFGDAYAIGETIRQISPYILAGLAVAFAFRTGLFNIGVEGQLIVGWFAAAYVGVAFELPKIIHLPLALLAAAAGRGTLGTRPWYFKSDVTRSRSYRHYHDELYCTSYGECTHKNSF